MSTSRAVPFGHPWCLVVAIGYAARVASDAGTELNSLLPKMSPLNPQYLTKKQTVFQKIAAFVEKFKGVGGQI